mmetsp:Transcript_14256/g.44839  ORF Transcript_14256/g.44839 Transcript_14256/m.44839 type:complete len:408 (+) Transcript_14256:1133-2356(+)
MSAEAIVSAFVGSGPACSSALSTSSPAASTALSASLTFSCSSALSSASWRSRSSLAALRSPSLARSRAMPTATFSRWKCSFFTPLPPSSARILKTASTVALGMTKSNSLFAYLSTSLRFSRPSLSASYLSKSACAASTFLRASAFRTARSRASLQLRSVASVPRVHSLMRCSSFARFCLDSEGGCPGTSWVFISWPLERMKSVQSFIFSLASWPASSTAFAVAWTSSSLSSLLSEKGSASSLRVLPAASASETSLSSSCMRASARSCASFRLLSISRRCSSTFRCCSLICSMRILACSKPCSASSRMRSFWEPQASSSFSRDSSSSLLSCSRVSGVAERTFWMTRRMLRDARCSSSFLRFSICCFFFSSSCCFMASCAIWLNCCCCGVRPCCGSWPCCGQPCACCWP